MNIKLLFFIISLYLSNTGINQTQDYCIPTTTNGCNIPPAINDLIESVWTSGGSTNITNMNSGCQGAFSYTGLSMIVLPGSVITLNMNAATGSPFQQGFAVWIDWNQDLIYDNVTERIYGSLNAPNSGTIMTTTFTVPPDIGCGTYRMRVRCAYATPGTNILPCGNTGFGETEDYDIIVNSCTNQTKTICLGDTSVIDYTTVVPPNTTSVVVSPTTNVIINTPILSFHPIDTTAYLITWTSPDSTWTDSVYINVDIPLLPTYAGADDTACAGSIVQLATPTLSNTSTDYYWTTIYPSGVNGGFIYLPDNKALAPVIVANIPGFYNLVFTETDINGICPDVIDTMIFISSIENHHTNIIHPSCFNYNDASIEVVSTGTLGAVEYSIDNGITFQSSNIFPNLTSGMYNIVSRDPAGCTFNSTATLIDPLFVILTVSSDTTVCENGTATLSASAINGLFFNYNWNHTPSTSTNVNLNPIADSIVTVYATNQDNCSSDTLSIKTFLHDPIDFQLNLSNQQICPGNNTLLEVKQESGGLNGYDYAWTENMNVSSNTTSFYPVNPYSQTDYCATVTDACETTPVTKCSTVLMHQVPVASFTSDETKKCQPAAINFEVLTPDNIVNQIKWKMNGKTFVNTKNLQYTFEDEGLYPVYLQIISPNGCVDDTAIYNYIEIFPIPTAEFYITPNPATIFYPVVQLINLTGGSNTYQWKIPNGTPFESNLNSPEVAYPEGIPNSYKATLIVTSENLCKDTISHEVIIESDVIIYAPNIFTPNGNFYNDNWRVFIDGIDIYEFHIQIFNRWGELVWESYDPEARWDGNMLNGTPVMDGTYSWVIFAKDLAVDRRFHFRGTVNLFR